MLFNFEKHNKMGSEIKNLTLQGLGYDGFFESHRVQLKLDGYLVARVTVEYRGAYKVRNANGRYWARITGKQMFKALSRHDYPAVGDWVAITELDAGQAVIHGLLPRRTVIQRKYSNKNQMQIMATNIDTAFVVESVDRDYSLNRFERYIAIANEGGVKPVILLNKIDLISKDQLDAKRTELKARFPDTDIILTSILTHAGLDELKKYIASGKTYCFLGSSGVGKSSLINTLLGDNIIKTEAISLASGRGKHATTSREMYFLENGGIVIDNPGMREVAMADTGVGIDSLFDAITALAATCKYADCTHIHEPGCQVLAALKSGTLDEEQYANYISLKKEAEHYGMTELEKRDKDRQFGKYVKKAKEKLKEYGHKNY
jgi:ribosome biogenesis GTPase